MHYQTCDLTQELSRGGLMYENGLVVDTRGIILAHDLSAHAIVGPLSKQLKSVELLGTGDGFNNFVYLGDTTAGKTTAIRAVCSALGGFASETSEKGRTLTDDNLIFKYDPDCNGIFGLSLTSHAGHNIGFSREKLIIDGGVGHNPDRIYTRGHGLVIDTKKPIGQQLDTVSPLLTKDEVVLNYAGNEHRTRPPDKMDVLFTRGNEYDVHDVSQIKSRFPHIEIGDAFSVNNVIESPTLPELDHGNIRMLANYLLRPTFYLDEETRDVSGEMFLYFGEEDVPGELEDIVVSNKDVGFRFEEKPEFDRFLLASKKV